MALEKKYPSIRVQAARVLLNELTTTGSYYSNGLHANLKNGMLILQVEKHYLVDHARGEAQTLEVNRKVDADIERLLSKLGVRESDVTIERPQNAENNDTFEKGTLLHEHRQSYYDRPRFLVPIDKVDRERAKLIVKQEELAREIETTLGERASGIGRKANIMIRTNERGQAFYSQLQQELEARGISHMLKDMNTQGDHMFGGVRIRDVAEGERFLEASKTARTKHATNMELERDERYARVEGMDEAAENMKRFFEKFGCKISSATRNFGSDSFALSFEEPVPDKKIQALDTALRIAIAHAAPPLEDNFKYISRFDHMKRSDMKAEKPTMVVCVDRVFDDHDRENAVMPIALKPEVLARLAKDLAGRDWSALVKRVGHAHDDAPNRGGGRGLGGNKRNGED